jgi:cytochrome c-type biogenesis protein CcmH
VTFFGNMIAVGAALLCVLATAFVLLPVLVPSFYRGRRQDGRGAIIAIVRARLRELENEHASGALDDSAYAQLKLEQERRLLDEAPVAVAADSRRGRGLLLVVALLVPCGAAAFYFYHGAWADWRIQQLLVRSEQQIEAGADNRPTLEALAGALEQRLQRRDDEDGRLRFMLARIDTEFGRYQGALVQYAALQKKFPKDPGIAAQYAQALYLAAGRRLNPEAQAQAQLALQLDPDQTTALGLLGIDAFERQDYAQALLHWRHLARMLPVGSPNAELIQRGIEQAEQKLGPAGLPGPKLVVAVSLAPELAAAVPEGATLFVLARAAGGSPMPLAVVRMDARKLPVTVTLDDSMAMAPGMNLSSATRVEVVARISASGQARAAPGDLEGSSAPLAPNGSQQLQLQISRKL